MHHISRNYFKPARRNLLLAGAVLTMLCLAALIWRLLPIESWLSRETLSGIAMQLRNDPLAALYVVAFYTLSGLFAFPVIILIPATAMIFGPLLGLIYSLCGLVANASVLYALGHFLGHDTLYQYAGNRVQQVSRRMARHGFITVALLRLFPVAPFFLINLISGASPIRFGTYTFATVTGIAPALIVMTCAGTQLKGTFDNPVPTQIIGCAITIVLLLVLGRWLSRKALKRTLQ